MLLIKQKHQKKCEITMSDVALAIGKFNKTAAQDYNQLTIMIFLYAHPAVIMLLKLPFNTMLKSGEFPKAFGDNVIIPAMKDVKKSVNDPSIYRPTNIIPIIEKVFESCKNSKLEKYFNFHDNRFGFVKTVVVIKQFLLLDHVLNIL